METNAQRRMRLSYETLFAEYKLQLKGLGIPTEKFPHHILKAWFDTHLDLIEKEGDKKL